MGARAPGSVSSCPAPSEAPSCEAIRVSAQFARALAGTALGGIPAGCDLVVRAAPAAATSLQRVAGELGSVTATRLAGWRDADDAGRAARARDCAVRGRGARRLRHPCSCSFGFTNLAISPLLPWRQCACPPARRMPSPPSRFGPLRGWPGWLRAGWAAHHPWNPGGVDHVPEREACRTHAAT